jgi:hypothetical protein
MSQGVGLIDFQSEYNEIDNSEMEVALDSFKLLLF